MRVVDYAREYMRRGWHIFPVHTIIGGRCTCGKETCPDAGKHPQTRQGHKEATADPEALKTWPADFNIGLATGAISGVTVIDIDIGEGKRGAESWEELRGTVPEPDTLRSITGSGGFHLFFRYNSALTNRSNALGAGIDVRNDGGYVVLPPSLHRSGNSYQWVDQAAPVLDLPPWLSRPKQKDARQEQHQQKIKSPQQAAEMLRFVDASDRDTWRRVGIILGREFNRSNDAWNVYVEWSETWKGVKGRNHDKIMKEAFNDLSQQASSATLTASTLFKLAIEGGYNPNQGRLSHTRFAYIAPSNQYLFDGGDDSLWVAPAVDSACGSVNDSGRLMQASVWLRQNRLCAALCCEPLLDEGFVSGVMIRNGMVMQDEAAAVYNTYRKPPPPAGDAEKAGPFIEHLSRLFPCEGDAERFLDYLAHRVQKPAEKPRFALLIAGPQGTGKDTAVDMCAPAIGVWNVANISPSALDERFNEFAKSSLVRISEAADLQEGNKWTFNERVKVLISGNPDYCTINPKYGQKYTVRLHCGVIITTNHLIGGVHIPKDDRRYDVLQTATLEQMSLTTQDAVIEYFRDLWHWWQAEGSGHIAAMLVARDISGFNAAIRGRTTEALRHAQAVSASSDDWLTDILDDLTASAVIRSDLVLQRAIERGLRVGEVRARIGSAMSRMGYRLILCPDQKDGRWRIGNQRTLVYTNTTDEEAKKLISQLKQPAF